VIVDAGAHDIDVALGRAHGTTTDRRVADRGRVAEVGIEVFDLGRPVGSEQLVSTQSRTVSDPRIGDDRCETMHQIQRRCGTVVRDRRRCPQAKPRKTIERQDELVSYRVPFGSYLRQSRAHQSPKPQLPTGTDNGDRCPDPGTARRIAKVPRVS
jgi:hypothetical protein